MHDFGVENKMGVSILNFERMQLGAWDDEEKTDESNGNKICMPDGGME